MTELDSADLPSCGLNLTDEHLAYRQYAGNGGDQDQASTLAVLNLD